MTTLPDGQDQMPPEDRPETERRLSPPSFYEREKGNGTTLVRMDSEGAVTAKEGARSAIGTFGLGGCTAVAVILENPGSPLERTAVMAHYSPLAIGVQMHERLGLLLRQHWSPGQQARAYIMVPGEWQRDDATGKYVMLPRVSEQTPQLAALLRASVPGLQDVSIRGYSESLKAGATEQGTLLVELPGEADGQVQVKIEGVLEPPVAVSAASAAGQLRLPGTPAVTQAPTAGLTGLEFPVANPLAAPAGADGARRRTPAAAAKTSRPARAAGA